MTSRVPDEFVALADFQRDAASHAKRIRATRRPQVLTIEGRPELVVTDAESYEQLLDLAVVIGM